MNKVDYELIYEIVRQIPAGKVSSYGAIAAAIGMKKAARIVGYAMNLSHHQPEYVPAHRVVNRIGMLTGRHHFNPPERMQALLKEEGIQVVDNKVVDFESVFWDPTIELGMI